MRCLRARIGWCVMADMGSRESAAVLLTALVVAAVTVAGAFVVWGLP